MNDEYCRTELKKLQSHGFVSPYNPEITKIIHFGLRPLIEGNKILKYEFESRVHSKSLFNYHSQFRNVWEAMQAIEQIGFNNGLPLLPHTLSSDLYTVIGELLRRLPLESKEQVIPLEKKRHNANAKAGSWIDIHGIKISRSSQHVRFLGHAKLYGSTTHARIIISRCLGNKPIGQTTVQFLKEQGKTMNEIDSVLKDINSEWKVKTGYKIFNRRGDTIFIAPIKTDAGVTKD